MRSKVRLLALSVALVAFLPAALADPGNGNGGGSGNDGNGNGNGNNGNGNGNGGPRPTPGLEAAFITSLGAAGYMGYRYLHFARK